MVGTYNDLHTGQDLVSFFQEHLIGLENSRERAFEFCRQLTEDLSVLRLIGELGNSFRDSTEAFYAFKPEAFTLHELYAPKIEESYTALPPPVSPRGSPQLKASAHLPPIKGEVNLPSSIASNKVKRSASISTYLSSALGHAATNVSTLAKEATAIAGERLNESRHAKAYREAETAEKAYRSAVVKAEEHRLDMDQAICSYLPYMQKCELERLRATRRVLKDFSSTTSSLVPRLQQSAEKSAILVDLIVPEQDLQQTIEIYKTGNYLPTTQVFHGHYDE